jgi:TolB-like protein/predicted Ser/Thr protein kinase
MLREDSRLGPYTIVRLIGAGGMGTVYEARDTRLGRRVAIKKVAGEFGDRFLREARIVASLNHPHICTLYDVGPDYLVMEFVEGRPLRGPLSLDAAREYSLQIADALDTAHRKGIVHRDLKPENILLTQAGVKLLDFGLAKVVSSVADETEALDNVTRAGMLLGTFPYMSPEQAEGRSVDARSDMFSFGTVLYELLVGHRPFLGNTQAATLASLLRDEPRPLRTARADVPETVALVVARCLRKRADERFQTAADLRTALAQARWDDAADAVSVAVLPFVNMNRDEDGEFFSDGVSEDIISALAKLPGLRVVARSAAFQFKGRQTVYEEVRDKLKVTAIVEGSVRRAGQRIRVTAELINAADGYQLWSERYDRVMDDVFAIQDEISRAIAGKLEVKLSAGQRVVTSRTNIEAYNLYLRGRQQFYKRNPAAFIQAEEYYRRSVAEDSGFAPSLAGLADCLSIGVFYGYRHPAQAIPEARRLLERALLMDANLPETHTSLGFLATVLLDFGAAEEHFLRSHQLKPEETLTTWWTAVLATAEGRMEEARALSHDATQLSPTVPMYSVGEGLLHLYSGLHESAIELIEKGLEMDRELPLGLCSLGETLAESGRLQEGIELLRRALPGLAPGALWARGQLGHYLGRAGDRAGAQKELDALLALREKEVVQSVAIAAVYAGIGELDQALARRGLERTRRASFLDSRRSPLEAAGRASGLSENRHALAAARRPRTPAVTSR